MECIYIDPPYNTGNEGWVYNDNASDVRFTFEADACPRRFITPRGPDWEAIRAEVAR